MAVIETMSVRRAVLPSSPRTQRTKAVAMTIVSESGGVALNIPYAPQDVNHTSLVNDYVTVPRPALMENVVYSNPMRPRMSFDLEIHDKKITASTGSGTSVQRAISVIETLLSMAKKGRVQISYGKLESGLWTITDLQVKSTRRDSLTDEIISANVTLNMIKESSTASTGPTTGGAKTTGSVVTTRTAPSTTKKAATPSTRTYTVKKGDTLWKIADKYYGDGSKWKKIADYNKIKDPRKLKVGQKLRVP
jgi:LysM repeat protein